MSYRERDFQQEFKTNNILHGCFELKLCKGKSIPFASVAEHQIEALEAVQSKKGLYYKIADQPVSAQEGADQKATLLEAFLAGQTGQPFPTQEKSGKKKLRFTKKKPFDCFYLGNIPSYVVIMFYLLRKKKNVYYILIDGFLAMRDEATRKSITEAMAEEYCYRKKEYLKKS